MLATDNIQPDMSLTPVKDSINAPDAMSDVKLLDVLRGGAYNDIEDDDQAIKNDNDLMHILTDDDNVYTRFNVLEVDPHAQYKRRFILKQHQVLPKYFMLANDTKSIILNYSLGSGKTATAVYAVLHIIKFNNNIDRLNIYTKVKRSMRKICVVGSWQTELQFKQELMRPCFDVIDYMLTKEISKDLNSSDKAVRHTASIKFDTLKRYINKNIVYYGYQSFFKALINTGTNNKLIQDVDMLIDAYEHNTVNINKGVLEMFANSVIIIDEMQRLYSYSGLNTYGIAVVILAKYLEKYNIKVIFLTGTPFNTSITEMESIEQLITGELKITNKRQEDYFKSERLTSGISIQSLSEAGTKHYMELLKDHYFYYNQNEFTNSTYKPKIMNILPTQPKYIRSSQPINMDLDDIPDNVFIPNIIKDVKDIKAIVLPYQQKLPQVMFLGNSIINDVDTHQPFSLCTLDMCGYQNETFNAKLSGTDVTLMAINDMDDMQEKEAEPDDRMIVDDNSFVNKRLQQTIDSIEQSKKLNSLSELMTAALPDGKSSAKDTFSRSNNGLWISDVFMDDRLKEYSIIAYTLLKLCLECTQHNEKTVIHTSRIINFGINQYKQIFTLNGYITYGTEPTEYARCKTCLKRIGEHNDEQHIFVPMYMSELTGTQTQNERTHIVNEVYNTDTNINGSKISVLFISDVAYSGVSLFHTHNICLITPVPNISKWRQIYSRVVRTNSHDLLPMHKRYVKVYTFTAKASDEPSYEKSFGNIYYNVKCGLNERIEDFIELMKPYNINTRITSKDYKMQLPMSIKTYVDNSFNADVVSELDNVAKYILDNNNATTWSPEVLVAKIKDRDSSNSYIDFSNIPDALIINTLIQLHAVEYDNHNNLVITQRFKDVIDLDSTDFNYKRNYVKYNTIIPANAFTNIQQRTKTQGDYLKVFESLTQQLLRKKQANLILNKVYVNQWQLLKDYDEIWRYLYSIGTEYYQNDENDFVNNHCSANRAYEKMIGVYNNNTIIIRETGECIPIKQQVLPESTQFANIFFNITCTKTSGGDQFNLKVIVGENTHNTNATDKRRKSNGVACTSYDKDKLKTIITNIDYNISKVDFCKALIWKACDIQLQNPEKKMIITPFEYRKL